MIESFKFIYHLFPNFFALYFGMKTHMCVVHTQGFFNNSINITLQKLEDEKISISDFCITMQKIYSPLLLYIRNFFLEFPLKNHMPHRHTHTQQAHTKTRYSKSWTVDVCIVFVYNVLHVRKTQTQYLQQQKMNKKRIWFSISWG